MASQEERERLIGKAVIDSTFREWLFTYPQEAAESLGIKLTDSEIESINQIGPKAAEEVADCVTLSLPSGGGGTARNSWSSQ